MPELERAAFAGRIPPWIRHEHLARYRFAAERAVDKVVVDCASGDGTCALTVAERAREVLAFDISEEAVSSARSGATRSNVRFAVASATALPLPDDSADLYVSLETIEHLPDQETFLSEVVRVLKQAGELICSTPDRDVCSPGNSIDSRPWNRFHVREYSQSELIVRLNQALKLPRFLHDRLEQHLVVPAQAERRYEYLVAVCSGPRSTPSS